MPLAASGAQAAAPLASWRATDAKKSIFEFVAKVTDEKSPGFVPAAERIAVFDNDGTLWPENPIKTFIVSGGGSDFMRVFSEHVYGIPPEQVVGSNTRVVYELREDGPVLVKTMSNLFVDDKSGKPAGIHQFIGRRPIACFGNSDGDKQILEYTTIDNPRPSLGLIVHHTDTEREYAYDKDAESSGKLVAALEEAPKRGWIVVDMKNDWADIFAP